MNESEIPCDGCGNPVIDCDCETAEEVEDEQPSPDPACPQCGGTGLVDDPPSVIPLICPCVNR